jgi:hypothetical protein
MKNLPVGGRIQKFKQNWINLVSDQWVLNIVSQGYKIEFVQIPQFAGVRETPLNKGPHQEALLEEVQQLLVKNAIEPVPKNQEREGFYSTFFLVPKKQGGLRPILNLKPLNKFIQKRSFKMESLRSVKRAVKPQDWLIAIDLQDAYLHIPIHRDFRKFLRFKIGNQVYQFLVLPFGLSPAPRIFTKVLAPLVAIARLEGLYLYPYLDDWLVKFEIRETLIVMGQRLVDLLNESGLLINYPKSSLEPSQKREFIGGYFQTDLNIISLPLEREENLLQIVHQFKLNKLMTARQFLQLLGTMAAAIEVINFCRLQMRPIQMYLMAHWNQRSRDLEALIPVNEHIMLHLEWWKDQKNLRQGVKLKEDQHQIVLTTDASSTHGWGGHMEHLEVQGVWEPSVKTRHINWLEMEAVFRTCHQFQSHLLGKVVLVRCDNSTVVTYINKEGGTRSPSLCMLTWKLLNWARKRDIVLRAIHVPGVENTVADRLSRVFASAIEWRLNPKVVQRIFHRWGSPLIDLFATESNRQLQVYCSRHHEPLAYHVDALTLNWSNMYGYAFPPISLIPLVLDRIEKYKCTIILIAPRWPRRSWFPRLLGLSIAFPIQIPVSSELLSQNKGRLQHPTPERLQLVAWKLSGNSWLVRDFRQMSLIHCNTQSETTQSKFMNAYGQSMYAGAVQDRLIPLQHL